ncbi:MAG: hypothetical protein HKN16_07275 [Saprospiraceae bacterium]|nr:hypothetical protein [Saprospiraceae bacterium]
MKNPKIDHLIEKYWEGETSLSEENELRQFLKSKDIDQDYEMIKPLFVGVAQQGMASPGHKADDKWLATLDTLEEKNRGGAKVIGMPQRNWWRIAAVALVLVAVGTWFTTQSRTYEKQEAIAAYEQTKEALAMLGMHMKTGQDKTAIGISTASKNLEIIQIR